MNTMLRVLLALAIFVTLCDAQCSFLPLDNKSHGCKDFNGKIHDFNSKWKDGCHKCSCTSKGTNCCSMIKTPVGYNQIKCQKIFHKESCSYHVVEKANPSKACEVKAYMK
ncbi:beta-microseminoprotein [Antechinus flavipes]|uniref:beta-microseminoprotein n=1 Tax=Antechinus flavipes TaxID=38775 RepID=UPI00223665C4|nr:beta-microseminoprotein [Antechinus flavipes]